MTSIDQSDRGTEPELDPRNDKDFAELVKRHHRDLLVFAHALTRDPVSARDIVQDAFVVAFDKVHTFDVTRDFPAWMRGIVRNKWREWLRKNRRFVLSENKLAYLDADVAAWQSARAAGESDLFAALDGCLDHLPDTLRDAVRATYYEGRSSDEAADLLNIAPAAVRKRLERARQQLRNCLEKKLPTSSTENSPESSSTS